MNGDNHLLRVLAAAFISLTAFCSAAAGAGLKDATLLLIRHAEKPDAGVGLALAGEARAVAYADYFRNFHFHSEPVKFDAVFAAADSTESQRPRLTITPAAKALGLSVNTNYKNKDYQGRVNELFARHEGRHVLICWHQGEIPALLRALGADPDALLPGGRWPRDEYDWAVVLRYDRDGRLKDVERIDEGLTTASHR